MRASSWYIITFSSIPYRYQEMMRSLSILHVSKVITIIIDENPVMYPHSGVTHLILGLKEKPPILT